MMNSIIVFILVLLLFLQVSFLYKTFHYRDKILNGKNFNLENFDQLFQLIEQSNPESIITLYSGKIPPIKIIKKQDSKSWWLEMMVTKSKRKKILEILKRYNYPSNKELNNPDQNSSIYIGYDMNIIPNIISDFYKELLGFNSRNYVRVGFKNTAVEESIAKNIMSQIH